VQEVVDRTNEIIDYATAKPAFEKWSNDFASMSGGLSKGNVRVMHNPKIVAGKVTDLSFNDAEKAIDVVVKVVDDNEWRKVVEGVYTGFSVGGGYGRKWKDEETGATRYTPVVNELSLVDNPCIPTARIAELHKANGSIEELHLAGRARDFSEIYRPARSFEEVMLAKGLVSVGQPLRKIEGLFDIADALTSFPVPGGTRTARPAAKPAAAAPRPRGRAPGTKARPWKMSWAQRMAHVIDRHPGKIALAGAALAAGATAYSAYRKKKSNTESGDQNAATALSEAELEQRRAAGKASAEKRRNRSGD
jgi:hypothetical protein